jgi:hypothetical protein
MGSHPYKQQLKTSRMKYSLTDKPNKAIPIQTHSSLSIQYTLSNKVLQTHQSLCLGSVILTGSLTELSYPVKVASPCSLRFTLSPEN